MPFKPHSRMLLALVLATAAFAANAAAAKGDANWAFGSPAKAIRKDIAGHFHCRWRMEKNPTFPERFGKCVGGINPYLDLSLSADEHDRFSYLEYSLATQLPYDSKRERARNQKSIALERTGANWLVDYFFPNWDDRRRWLDATLPETTHIPDFHPMMVGKMGIALRNRNHADRDDVIIMLGITAGNPDQWAPG